MKRKIIFTLCLVLALTLSFPQTVSADVILPNTHPVDWNVKFVNLNQFPDIVLIAHLKSPFEDYNYTIANNERLTKRYHADILTVYWNTKDKLNSITLIDPNKSLGIIDPNGPVGDYGYVPDSNPLIKETIEYSVAGFLGSELKIYISKQTSEYKDGSPVKVENFDNPWAGKVLSIIPTSAQPSPNPAPIQITPTTPVPPELMSPAPVGVYPPLPTGGVDVNVGPAKQGFWQSLTYEQQFPFALLLTLIIEIPIAIIVIKALYKRREINTSKIILVGAIASALTLPYLWFILPAFIPNRVLYIWLGEASVVLIEAIIYNRLLKLKVVDAAVVSLIANVASVLVGLVLL
jgi:hypothetical protein